MDGFGWSKLLMSTHSLPTSVRLRAESWWYEQARNPLLQAILTWSLHRKKLFLFKTCLLFLWDGIWFYVTAAAVNESNLATEVVVESHKSLRLRYGPLVLSLCAQRRTDLLKRGEKILKRFEDTCQHYEGCGTPLISQIWFHNFKELRAF